MQKHLVTGAAGFIGSHLIDRLLERGATVVGIDNLTLGRRENLAKALSNPRFRFHVADVNDVATFSDIVADEQKSAPVDMAWHLAANSDIRAGTSAPDVDLRDTFLTTYHLLEVLRTHKISNLVFASTSAIYGVQPTLLTENMGPLFPISNYGAMKLASEAVISAALESNLKQVWICRFPNVIGSRATHGVIYDFVMKLQKNLAELEVLGDGTQSKPYLHVSELVDAMIFITDHAAERRNYFNIGTVGSVTTVRYIAEGVVHCMAPGAVIHYTGGNRGWVGDVPKFAYSVDKLKKLGWSPRLTSDQAVDQAVEEIIHEIVS